MNVDQAIKDAIKQTVQENDQPENVTKKILKWLQEIISGNESIENQEAVYNRLDNIITAVEASIEEIEE